ncbi:MAG TPA: hypothetical protein PK843_08210 [bacterium]|nr:hypothetical protein [bacterium]
MDLETGERPARLGGYAKRGVIYAAVSTAGLLYEFFWDRPIKWFAVAVWFLILGLGVYLLLFKKDQAL